MRYEKNIVEAVEVVKGMSKEAVCYWLAVMVTNGDLTEAEAGYILTIK